MKKIYILLFLAPHIFSTSCMAQEYKQSMFPHDPYGTLTKSNSPQQTLHQIAFTAPTSSPYITDLVTEEDLELKPTYTKKTYSTNKTITNRKETQPLLRTLKPVIPDEKLIEKLYNETLSITQNFSLQSLLQLITNMNNAKNHNINEDVIGKYSYDIYNACELYNDDLLARVILFLGYLKQYGLTANQTEEGIPNIDDISKKEETKIINNKLAHILKLPSPANTITTCNQYDSILTAAHYPTFHTLHSRVQSTFSRYENHKFISYIYSDQEAQHNEFTQLSYDYLKEQFYHRARWLCVDLKTSEYKADNYLYDLIKIIEAGKALIPQKEELHFRSDIIESEQTLVGKVFALVNIDHTSLIRKKIGILCSLIKKYNDDRTTKITPTKKHRKFYKLCPINFALPDSCGKTLFDEKVYAFKEFEELINHFNELIYHSSEENIQECIHLQAQNNIIS